MVKKEYSVTDKIKKLIINTLTNKKWMGRLIIALGLTLIFFFQMGFSSNRLDEILGMVFGGVVFCALPILFLFYLYDLLKNKHII